MAGRQRSRGHANLYPDARNLRLSNSMLHLTRSCQLLGVFFININPILSSKTMPCLTGPYSVHPTPISSPAVHRRPASRLLYSLRLMTPVRLLMFSFAALTSPSADRGYISLKSLLLRRVRLWRQLDQSM
jgi:hypothetical protein